MALDYNGCIYPNPVSGLAPGALLTHFAPIALFTEQSINNYTLTCMTSIHAFDINRTARPRCSAIDILKVCMVKISLGFL